MKVFQYADLILYATDEPTPEQLALIIKLYNNTGYQGGAVQAMTDPFVDNITWFDEYDRVLRLNLDVFNT
jgi:hypothetical protein